MTSLTEAAYYTRKSVNYGIIGIIVLIFLRICWTIAANYWVTAHPPPPPPPNMAFGKLPALQFSENGKKYDYNFQLQTISGNFPESSPSAKVFFMPILSANLLSLDRASEKARKMGFNGAPVGISTEEYLWTDQMNPLRTLKINIINGNLSLRYDYRQDQSLLQSKDLPIADSASREAKSILENYELAKDDLTKGEIKVTNVRLVGGVLSEVSGVVDADFVRIQFLRTPIGDAPVLTPSMNQSPASVMISGSKDAVKRVVELDYNYQLIDQENFATYPIKTPSEAFDELKRRAGYIADQGNLPGSDRIIRNIYLAYFDSLKLQTYLEPIFVFEGDKGFRAYVPAVNNQWLEALPTGN